MLLGPFTANGQEPHCYHPHTHHTRPQRRLCVSTWRCQGAQRPPPATPDSAAAMVNAIVDAMELKQPPHLGMSE